MNRAYRIVWSAARQAWVVASEKAASGGRPPLAVKRAAAVLLLLGVTGSALATDYSNSTVSSGTQHVIAGDKAVHVTVDWDGYQFVHQGGSVNSTTVNDHGSQYIQDGGSATDTTLNSGGSQYIQGGSVTNTTVNSGSQYVSSGGFASYTVLNDGQQSISVGGSATNTMVNSGGYQNVFDGGSATSTTVNSGGHQHVFDGGSATDTVLNGGHQDVSPGGSVASTTVNSGGEQYISTGGSTANTTVNAGGSVGVYGGSASNATLNSGGSMAVWGGSVTSVAINSGGRFTIGVGIADGVTQSAGGVLGASTQATISGTNTLGGFSVSSGHARNLLLENGGELLITSGDIASDTTVNSGGTIGVTSGGILDGTTTLKDGARLTDERGRQGASVINNGTLDFRQQLSHSWSGNLTGSGQLTKDGSGTLTLNGTLNQQQVNLNDGSLVMDGLQAVTNIIAHSGTSLSLVNSTTLTGSIDPTDVSIDGGSTWNITGDSQVNSLTNAGNVVFAPPQGAFIPHTLTVSSFTGSGGTLTLNTVAGDSSSPTDKVVIDGGRATGNTNLNVLNHGGLGAQTAGSGIPVIQAINGAATDAGAFSMSKPLVAGAYEYSLYRNADESWYLTTQKTSGGGTSGGGTSGGGTSGGGTSGGSAVPSGEVNYRAAMWSYAAMPSLSMDYDRLVASTADTRFRYAPDSRIWGRLAAGQLRHPDSGSLTGGSVPESSSAYSFFQLGGDLWQLDGANADWRAGIYGATGLMRSDVWRDSGTASAGTDRDTVYTGGAYLSGRSHSGLHIDGLLQASRHSLKAASEDGTRLSTHGTGWLASAEVGQAFTLTPSLALEPQLQYTVQGLSLGDAQDEAASLSWSGSRRQSVRAGLKLGTPQGAKAKLAWWVTPSVTQSYGGRSGFTASVPGVAGSEASFRRTLSGTRVGLSGGVNAHIRENVTLGVQAGWSESLHGGEAGGYSGMLNLGVSFR